MPPRVLASGLKPCGGKNISANNEAMLLKLGRDVISYIPHTIFTASLTLWIFLTQHLSKTDVKAIELILFQ